MIIKIPTPYKDIAFSVRDGSKSDSLVIKEIFDENVYRLHDSMLNGNGVVLDVGANIGAFTIDILLRAKNSNKPVTIYAIEPEPSNRKQLKINLELNKWLIEDSKVIICDFALGDKNELVKISDEHGDSRIGSDGSEVQMKTFNAFLEEFEIDSVDIAKFDIEGSEIPLLLSASDSSIDRIRYSAIEFDESNGLDNFSNVINRFARKCSISTLGVPARGCYIYTERHIQ